MKKKKEEKAAGPAKELPEKKKNKSSDTLYRKKATVGRPKFFETPEALMRAAVKYFKWVDSHPWRKAELMKSGPLMGTAKNVPVGRPYSIGGFCVYHGTHSQWFQEFKRNTAPKEDAESQKFMAVINYVEETIRTNKFEGATIGAFNANIISRELGLIDKKDITTDGQSMNNGFYEFVRALNTKQESDGSSQ